MAKAMQAGGYNTDLFVVSQIDDSCTCSICHDVLRNHIELACQHIYCNSCIIQVLNSTGVCPDCKQKVEQTKDGDWAFELPRRYFTNMHSSLRLKCDMGGCDHICTIEGYQNHQYSCEFNPNRVLKCDKCKTEIVVYEKNGHDCVQSLLKKVNDLEQGIKNNVSDLQESRKATKNIVGKLELRIKELEDDRLNSVVKELKNDLNDLTREIKNLKLFIKENASPTTIPPVLVETVGPRQPDPMAMFYAQQLAMLQNQLAGTQPPAQHFGVAMNADTLTQQHVVRQAMFAQLQQQQQNVMAGRYVAAVTPPRMGGVPRPLLDVPLMSEHTFNQSQSAHVVPSVVPVTTLRPALATTTTNVAPVVLCKLPESVPAALSVSTAPIMLAAPLAATLVASSGASKTPESIINTSTTAAQRSGHKDSETSVDTCGVDPHFEPVVPLPDKVEQVTGEEGLEVLMEGRCRVDRYEGCGDWRERGTGCLKVLKEPDSGRVRLLMRRALIYKICLNHYINSNMKLIKKTDLCWTWCAMEIESDENNQLIPMKFAIRFKTVDLAARFGQLFEAAKCSAPSPNTSVQTSENEAENNTASATFSLKPKVPLTDAIKNVRRVDKDNLIGSALSATTCSPFALGFSSSKPLATRTPQSNYIAGGSAKNVEIALPKFAIAKAGPTLGGFFFGQKSLVISAPATTTVDKNKDGLKPDKNQPEVDEKPSSLAAFSLGEPTNDVTASSGIGGTVGTAGSTSTLINSTPVFGNKESTSSFSALARQLESKPVFGSTDAFVGFVGAGSKDKCLPGREERRIKVRQSDSIQNVSDRSSFVS